MGKMYRSISDVEKEEDSKLHRTKHFHPQLNDDIKREIIRDRKRQDKARSNTFALQRQLKEGDYDNE